MIEGRGTGTPPKGEHFSSIVLAGRNSTMTRTDDIFAGTGLMSLSSFFRGPLS